jgi:hypothetical protein
VHESFEHLRGLAKVLTYWMPPPKALSFTHVAVMCHQKGELGVHLVSHNKSEFDKSRAGAPCYYSTRLQTLPQLLSSISMQGHCLTMTTTPSTASGVGESRQSRDSQRWPRVASF